jgi:hypothetical protein
METLLASALLVGPTPTGGGQDVSESTYTGKHYAPRWESWRQVRGVARVPRQPEGC